MWICNCYKEYTMKKVLIWDTFQRINAGGPSGYLYNIHEYLQSNPTEQVTFLTDLVLDKYGDAEWLHPSWPWPYTYHPKTFLGHVWRQISKIYCFCIKPFKKVEYKVPNNIDIDKFDYVHIHQVTHFQQFKKLFPNYKGKIILTSHSPCPFSDELIERTAEEKSKLYRLVKLLRPYLLRLECDAYNKANYIMFPCAGARESYEKHEIIRKTFNSKNNKFFYVTSSLVDYLPDNKSQQKISDFGIPCDAFVISYFGRHIPIKGYDILTKVGLQLLEKHPKLYFLCGGNGIIPPPSHPRWIELGFIKNVDDLLPQSDLYILPNRETFFDLITLQIFRAGVPLALSLTGGNKYFLELPENEISGMAFFNIDDEDRIIKIVDDVMAMKISDSEQYNELRWSNRRLYEHYFTLDKYIKNYIRAIEQL